MPTILYRKQPIMTKLRNLNHAYISQNDLQSCRSCIHNNNVYGVLQIWQTLVRFESIAFRAHLVRHQWHNLYLTSRQIFHSCVTYTRTPTRHLVNCFKLNLAQIRCSISRIRSFYIHQRSLIASHLLLASLWL